MRKILIGAAVILVLLFGTFAFVLFRNKSKPQISVKLADGRTLHIEAVTFGTNHQVGARSPFVERFGPWMPLSVRKALEPKYPHSRITHNSTGLVVWVNATDDTGKHIDCQSIRVEFVNKHGDLFGEEHSSWSGFDQKFWRVGHRFSAYPRDEPTLTFRITPMRTNVTTVVEFPNPHVMRPATWSGESLPQRRAFGGLEIALADLVLRTNGSPKRYWETQSVYWEPVWEFRANGQPASGYEQPKWSAEDPLGNTGQFLGVRQPVLKYFATFYPTATNAEAAMLVGALPAVNPNNLQSNILWNTKLSFAGNEIFVFGIFPPGTQVFSDGEYLTNPPVAMGAVQGGAPSGWTSQSRRVTPLKVQSWHGHYTPVPTIYLKAPKLPDEQIVGLRLRDEQGRYWVAKPESQRGEKGVHPFLLELSPEVKSVVPEVVVLRPIKAEFMVKTPAAK